MIPDSLDALKVPVAGLKHYGKNPRTGNVDAIAESLSVNGQYRPVVVNSRTNEVLAGNHTLKAAKALGWTEIAATFVDADEEQAARIVLVDNRSNDLAEYDNELLTAMLEDLPDLGGTGFDAADLDTLLASITELPPTLADPDDVPDAPADPVSVLGDVWLLGQHRVVCGDSDDVNVHDVLLAGNRPDVIFSDPPYGMNLDTDYSSMPGGKEHRQVIGDDRPFDVSPYVELYPDVVDQFWWGADYYRSTLPSGGSWIVWDKHDGEGGGQFDELFGSSFELCWSRKSHARKIARVTWATSHGRDEEQGGATFLHPTQKPVALVTWFLEKWSDSKAIVLDLFGGSGSTLIACHQTGRIARLVELDPRYVDVICRRYQDATGDKPILESTGEPHDFSG